MSVSLRQLEYFITVAEAGTVTGAAARLYLSQSAVSNAINDLEQRLGVYLFVRHPRGLTLTKDGAAVLGPARALLRDAEDLERNAALLGTEITGTLTIGCYSTIAPLLLPRVLAEFATRHPQVRVEFAEGSRSELLHGLTLGRFDTLVLYDYRFKDDLDDLGSCHPLGSMRPYVLLPPGHELVGTGDVDLPRLADDPFLLFGLEPADEYFLSILEHAGVTPNVRFRTGNYEVLRGLVARGMGYSLLSQRAWQSTSHEGLGYHPAEVAGYHLPLDVVALTPGTRRPPRRVEAFLDIARDAFEASPGYPNS